MRLKKVFVKVYDATYFFNGRCIDLVSKGDGIF